MRLIFLFCALFSAFSILAQEKITSVSLVPDVPTKDTPSVWDGKIVVELKAAQVTKPAQNGIPFCFVAFAAHNFTKVPISELVVDIPVGPVTKRLTFTDIPATEDEVLHGAAFFGDACLNIETATHFHFISCTSPQLTQEECASRFVYLPLG